MDSLILCFLILPERTWMGAGRTATPDQLEMLARGRRQAQSQLQQALRLQWCDAVPLLLAMQWTPLRQQLMDPLRRPTTSAVQAWLQVPSGS